MTYTYKKAYETGMAILDQCAAFTNAPYQESENIKYNINKKLDELHTASVKGNHNAMDNKIIFSLYDTLMMYSIFIFNNKDGKPNTFIDQEHGKLLGKLKIIKILRAAD